jgi:Asp-tRNA(Asn)/Glu-tRNA(Gln) amidotransferase A subunit family amidase
MNMSTLDLLYTPALELARRIREGELSPLELMENCLQRIEYINPLLNCFCFVYADEALALARQAGQTEPAGPMHGVPFAVKDVTPTAGKTTTRGSKVYQHWVPHEDALIVKRFKAAGAIIVGKTTTPEFAYDSFTQSPLWGITRNPWTPDRTPGGSSGGSGAAVASGCVPLAEGTDMGGSVRIPASFCGLVGLKPSLGRIPMDILPTVFDNISHFGPLARTVSDANLFMNIAGGPSERDIMSLPDKLEFPLPAQGNIRALKLALCPDLGYYALNREVEAGVRQAAAALAAVGAQVDEVQLNWTKEINDVWFDLWGVYLEVCFAEDFEHWRNEMDPNVVALIERGRAIDACSYKRFEVLRTRQWHELCRIFDSYDALLCPTTAHPAPEHGASDMDFQGLDKQGRYKGLDMTCPFNLIGQCPALSVPSGFSQAGLPLSLQIIGRRFDDLTVMRIGAALEQVMPWADKRPAI